MSTNSRRMEQMSTAQRTALALRLRKARQGRGSDRQIPPRPRGMVELPLTFMQEQLWFLDQLTPGSPTYNIPCVIRLRGRLEVSALEQALHRVVERHESLRTSFINKSGRPLQVVVEKTDIPLALVDLRTQPGEARAAALDELCAAQARQPFTLSTAPLLRAQLVRLREDEQVLLLTVHHIVFDAWSYSVLLGELGTAYEAFVSGEEPSLPELVVQYGDYALWQRDYLQGDAFERLRAYWTERLGEDLPTVALPQDRPRPGVRSYLGGSLRRQWDGLAADGVHALARDQGTTIFAALLAGFFTLLHRYTGQTDLVLGTPSANRTRTELEPLVGFFVNMLVIRADLSGDPTFRELLGRMHEAVLGAQQHQDLPFSKLVDTLRPDREATRSPLFQISFAHQSQQRTPSAFGGLTLETETTATGQSRFDLSLTIEETETALGCSVEYSAELFDEDRIQRLIGHLGTLLAAAIANPDARISTLALLSDDDRRRVIHDANQTASPVADECIHELFERQVARASEAIAAVMGDRQLTYGQLNREANQIARVLRGEGVGPGALVGICMDRSLRRLAGILGILKAGAGYVPLDPAYPPERLGFMLDDTSSQVVLVDGAGGDRLPPRPSVQTLRIDGRSLTDSYEDHDLGPTANNRDVAYVIYTSGSTGTPKGVVIEHRALANFVTSTRRLFEVTPADRVLQFASLNFDVSVFETFTALTSGAALVLADVDTLLSPMLLTRLMIDARVTITDLPPAVMALLPADEFGDLRIVFVGGEAFSVDLVDRWALPGRRFFNGYGPTEATVTVIVKECEPGLKGSPPIGRPMANHRAYVLDGYGNPTPIGVPGELHIGGVGLARGYLGRDELTGQRFIRDPFSQDPHSRLYKTGDVACFLPDGDLRFLGRIDDQVKIRGYRIELGEIAAVLGRHPGVDQAVAVVHSDGRDTKELVAYATAHDVAPDRASVREHLAAHLPAYMIPAHVMFLDALPMTRSGKLDRAALPAPEQRSGEDGAAPTTLTEAIIADEIFADILGTTSVGADDSFFELGGNSLQAMQLLSRIRDTFNVELDVPTVFRAPTPVKLAEILRDGYGISDARLDDEELLAELEGLPEEEVNALLRDQLGAPGDGQDRPSPTEQSTPGPEVLLPWTIRPAAPAVAFVHAVGGSVLPYAALVERLGATFATYGLQSAGLNGATPHATIAAMGADYLQALDTGIPGGMHGLCGWSMGGLVAFEMARLLQERGQRARVVLIDTGFPQPYEDGDLPDETEMVRWFASDLAALGMGRFREPSDLADRSLSAQLAWVTDNLPFDDESTQALWATQVAGRFAVFKANVLAMAAYRPRPVDADVLVVRASESDHELAAWQGFVRGRFRIVDVTGNHYQLLGPPLVEQVSELLIEHLSG